MLLGGQNHGDRTMKKLLTGLLLHMGCFEYQLNRIPDTITSPEDTGVENNENLVSYDSCDPYDGAWEVHPDGGERPECYGIEGMLRPDYEAGGLCTRIYYGACFPENTYAYPFIRYHENAPSSNGFLVRGEYCGSDPGYEVVCMTTPGDTSNLNFDFDLWFIMQDENRDGVAIDGQQLYGFVQCRDDEKTITECTGGLY